MNKKHIIIFIALNVIASFFNYATYPAVARLLPANQFVHLTVALSLLTQMSTLLSSIVVISTSLTKEKTKKSHHSIEVLQSATIYLLLAVIALFLLFSPYILPLIKVPILFVLPIGLMLLLAVPISVVSGYLNGKRLLTKLGLTAAGSAILQFSATAIIAKSTRSGSLALLAMAGAQLVAIAIIYTLLKKEKLPNIRAIFKHSAHEFTNQNMRALIRFTLLASIGVMLINLLQILDLLVVQSRQVDEKMYADLYIISRTVFFAGTIFVWPFIAATDLQNAKINIQQFLKLCALLLVIGAGAALGVVIFGKLATQILFGTSYSTDTYLSVGTLSIAYKFSYMVLYAALLFFIVMRNYLAVIIPICMAIISALYVALTPHSSTVELLIGLNVVALIGALVSVYGVLKYPTLKS